MQIIGQSNLKQTIEDIIENKKFPRFCIFTGLRGSGKKLFANYVGSYLNVEKCICENDVNTVRNVIEQSYLHYNPVVYYFFDADTMSSQAQNALLKIIEEPPNNAYFIMTLEDENNTLSTIRSRAQIFKMENYSQAELLSYINEQNYKLTESEIEIIKNVCETPGEIDKIVDAGVEEFYNYVVKVVDNIAEVQGSNAFKISERLALKKDAEGYDIQLFFKTFMSVCMTQFSNNPLRFAIGVRITSKYMRDLKVKGINKQSLFDAWLLEIRKEWE